MKSGNRLDWFQDARFGMSLHWGIYSIPARGEWVRSVERLSDKDYQRYFDTFDPDPGCAEEWARTAVRAGMKYCVLTAKHHDGFCLFDSALTEFKSTNTPAGRDLVREYVDAFRAAGIRVGLYYSLVDWHHPDYPAWKDRQHPLRDDPAAEERDAGCSWSRYIEYLHGQVEELLTNYGKIDVLYFDFSYWDFMGEAWDASRLVGRIRELQPDILLNDRLGKEPIKQVPRPAYAGDFDQSEQDIPREPMKDRAGNPVPWEAWATINNSWCYDPLDAAFKSPALIVRSLVNCVSKGGNFNLNLSPDARGHLDPRAVAVTDAVGAWLKKNGESIYGCGEADLSKPEWGRYTRKGSTLYAHVMEQGFGHYSLQGLRGALKNGRTLADGAEAFLCDFWNPGVQTFDDPDDAFFNIRRPVQSTFPLPDEKDTVVRFEYADAREKAAALDRLDREFEQAVFPRNRENAKIFPMIK